MDGGSIHLIGPSSNQHRRMPGEITSADKFRMAREIAGLREADLARRLKQFGLQEMTQDLILGIEAGRWTPPKDVVDAIAAANGFDSAFFWLEDPPGLESGGLGRTNIGLSRLPAPQARERPARPRVCGM